MRRRPPRARRGSWHPRRSNGCSPMQSGAGKRPTRSWRSPTAWPKPVSSPCRWKRSIQRSKPFVPSAGDVRAVLDTNVLLSGLLWRGTPHALVEEIRAGALTLISSPALLAELAEVMNRPKFQAIMVRSNTDPERMLSELWRLAEIIDPPPLPAPVSRDPADDAVLALAAASQADLIISGDADLLTLGSHAGIPIIDAAEAVSRISG